MIFDSEALRNTVIAGASTIPALGGTISVILDKYLPSYIEIRCDKFIKQLSDKIICLKSEMSDSIWKSTEFATIFSKTLEYVICELREDKIQSYQNILLNVTKNELDFDTAEYFLKLVSILTMDQLVYLNFADNSSIDLMSLIKGYPHIDRYYLTSIVTELERYKLVHGKKLTKMGRRFIKMIMNE